jgi:hypothetical protein
LKARHHPRGVRYRSELLPAMWPGVEAMMYFAAVVLTVLSGLFFAAGQHEIGSFGADMCRYGSTFCDNPVYILVGAGLAAIWGKFVSVR